MNKIFVHFCSWVCASFRVLARVYLVMPSEKKTLPRFLFFFCFASDFSMKVASYSCQNSCGIAWTFPFQYIKECYLLMDYPENLIYGELFFHLAISILGIILYFPQKNTRLCFLFNVPQVYFDENSQLFLPELLRKYVNSLEL